MKKLAFVILGTFIVGLLLFSSIQIFKSPAPTISTQPPTQKALLTFTGVIRTVGERQGFQLTDLNEKSYTYNGEEYLGFLIQSTTQNFNQEHYLGKCVKVNLDLSSNFDGKTTNNDRLYAHIDTIEPLAYEQCTPYGKYLRPLEKQTDFTGVIKRFERPAPDIGYDYILDLDEPYLDTTHMSGIPTNLDATVLIPLDDTVWKDIEETIGMPVKVSGAFEWGYAESKFLRVSSVVSLEKISQQ